MKNKIFCLLLLVLFLKLGYSQDLTGTWIQVPIPNFISSQRVNILKFEENNLYSYDFKQLIDITKIELFKDSIIFKDSLKLNYKFLDDRALEQFTFFNERSYDPTIRYVRLTPTKLHVESIDNLLNKTIRIKEFTDKFKFVIGQRKKSEHTLILENPTIVTDLITVERFNQTYFLCLYLLDNLHYAFPIKEIFEDGFTIYAVPEFDSEILAELIKVESKKKN